MSSYLITGASRGLGLALAAELAASPASEVSIVFAATRQTNGAQLADLVEKTSGRVVPLKLDPTDPESLQAAVAEVERKLQGKGLDVLVNNVGVMPLTPGKIEKLSGETLNEAFNINVTVAHLVTVAFLPLLRKGSRKDVANITTTVGSIGLAHKYKMSPAHAYKISKAGLNMLTVQYAQEYAEEGFSFFGISPGWLKTELGGEWADLPVEVGAKETVKYIKQGGPELNGRNLNIHVPGWENAPGANQYDGTDAPW